MTNPRGILNKLKWHKEFDLKDAEIWYIHRGAPNDTMIIQGSDIIELDRSFIKTNKTMIPYHRIFKIIYRGKTIFER